MYRWRATFLKHAFLHSIKPLRTAAFSAKVLLQNSFFQKSYFCKTAYFSEKQDSAGPTSGELLSQNGWLFKAAICNVCSGPFFKAVCYFILKEQLRSPILSNRPDFFIISDGVIHFLVFQSSNLYLSGDRWNSTANTSTLNQLWKNVDYQHSSTLFQRWNLVENESWADVYLSTLFQHWQTNVGILQPV